MLYQFIAFSLFKEINYIKINQITTFLWCLFRLSYERNALNIILFFENGYHFFCRQMYLNSKLTYEIYLIICEQIINSIDLNKSFIRNPNRLKNLRF
jgi:hypothetical protein